MYLSEISIRNFRLFESLDLTLNAGLNVVVGENNSGKTGLIDAIRYTLGANSSERSYVQETDFRNPDEVFTIQLKFSEVHNHAHRFVEHLTHEEFKDDAGKEKRRPVLYIQLEAKFTGRERRGYPYIQTSIKSGREGNGLSIEAEIRDFLAVTYLKPLRDAESEMSSGRGSRLAQILNSSDDVKKDMDNLLKIIAEANDQLLKTDGSLKSSAEKIQNDYLHQLIFESDKERFGAFIDIAGLTEGKLAELAKSDADKRRYLRAILESLSLRLTKDRHLHGLGYQNLLFIAAELLLLEQEADNEFPLLLIEEPEAHLQPQLQMKLLQFINSKVQSEKNKKGIQCILTTHSPNLSSKANPSEIILMNQGNSWSLREGETLAGDGDYQFMRKFLDATKANVFFARGLLFVEGASESILLPTLARLLGRPLEDHGVSVVKYDNSGSWKRFAKLFLRKAEANPVPTRIGVIRDLDLWPASAEEISVNKYGFKTKKQPDGNKPGNLDKWEKSSDEVVQQIKDKKEEHKNDTKKEKHENDKEGSRRSLEKQNVKIFISDRWTLEFCLARFGLFEECYEAINGSKTDIKNISGSDDDKATYIQSKVSKTDFAYTLASILELQLEEKIQNAKDKKDKNAARQKFSADLRKRLPKYLVDAIEYVTPAKGDVQEGVKYDTPN